MIGGQRSGVLNGYLVIQKGHELTCPFYGIGAKIDKYVRGFLYRVKTEEYINTWKIKMGNS